MDDALTPAKLERIGKLLYGLGWKPALARDLGLRDEGRIDRMARGLARIPPGFREELKGIARARLENCQIAIDALGAR